ncbi:MAG TPA: hypothetical protein VLA56_06050 [Pseudomonadales bacterium]|nr:hypothetical protein [Pseudomonadales bacterium]
MRAVLRTVLLCCLLTDADASWPTALCASASSRPAVGAAVLAFLRAEGIDDASISETCVPLVGRFPAPADAPERLQIRLLREAHEAVGAFAIRRWLQCDVLEGVVEGCRRIGLRADVDGGEQVEVAEGLSAARLAELWPIARRLPRAGERVRSITLDRDTNANALAGHGYVIWTGRPGWCGETGHPLRWSCAGGRGCGWMLAIGEVWTSDRCD